ncbi:MAG TPA: ribosome biogenesis GTPase Der [Blastocatellia bacterium]|nr:ribosome biogenesis GTPase Der [Blastocatellia bacterium]
MTTDPGADPTTEVTSEASPAEMVKASARPHLVAIVGRPNVGKSTLFNKMTGMRRAIVGDEPGITRDRLYGKVEWRGRQFRLVDTGGIIPSDTDVIPANILRQARAALDESSLILLAVDARAGITPMDEELQELLRPIHKPVLVAANKVDSGKLEDDALEFAEWGFEVLPVSAEHGNGVGDLLDRIIELLPDADGDVPVETPGEINLAIIGRPNVGKSSLLNQLTGEERVIVSSVPGTTRDSVDAEIERNGVGFRLVDTAGIRRKGKPDMVAEKVSVVMARRSVELADVAILLIDGVEGPTALDATIGGDADRAGAGLIIAVNKWDAVEKTQETTKEYERRIREMMKFADYAPIIFISAKTGQRTGKLLEAAAKAHAERNKRVPTAELNRFFERHLEQPRATTTAKNAARVLYITQAAIKPPTFVLFTTSRSPKARLHFSYERYVQNRLREEFVFFGTPIRIKQRGKKGAESKG